MPTRKAGSTGRAELTERPLALAGGMDLAEEVGRVEREGGGGGGGGARGGGEVGGVSGGGVRDALAGVFGGRRAEEIIIPPLHQAAAGPAGISPERQAGAAGTLGFRGSRRRLRGVDRGGRKLPGALRSGRRCAVGREVERIERSECVGGVGTKTPNFEIAREDAKRSAEENRLRIF